jgi:hypothetical protein
MAQSNSNQPPSSQPSPASNATDFARQAEGRQQGAVMEMWGFLRHSKKWWLTPIIVALVMIGLFLLLSATAAGPLIYTLF